MGPPLADYLVEHLPFEDDTFDVVMSSIGVMFAPHHQAAAAVGTLEVARHRVRNGACRRGLLRRPSSHAS